MEISRNKTILTSSGCKIEVSESNVGEIFLGVDANWVQLEDDEVTALAKELRSIARRVGTDPGGT